MAYLMTCKNFIVMYLIITYERIYLFILRKRENDRKGNHQKDKNIRGVSRKCSLCNSAVSAEEINASPF